MKRGIALTEVLVAVLVLALAMVPVMFMFPSGARRTAFGEAQLRAHLRAQALLAQAIDMAIRAGFRNLREGEPISASEGQGVRETVRFETVPGFPGLWTVVAQVEWESPAERVRQRHTYALRRLIHLTETGLIGDWRLSGP